MQNDLISRQAVIELLQKNMSNDIQDQIITENNINLIRSIPTVFNADNVVGELQEHKTQYGKLQYARNNANMVSVYVGKEQTIDCAIEIVKRGGVSDGDVCEWHKVKNGNAYKCDTHAEIHDSRVLDWYVCPYCEKKIKVVE